MNETVETTVIGSYPVSLNTLKMMDDYTNGVLPLWEPYIKHAVSSMSDAGIDLISDGQTRDPFINIFARGFQGCRIRSRAEVIGPVDLLKSITKNDLTYVSSIIPKDKKILGLLVGPCTLSESVVDYYYNDKKELAFAFANALKKELKIIEPLVDMISIDEPFFSNSFPEYAKELISMVLDGISCPTRMHVCGDVSSIVKDIVDFPVDILSHEFKATPDLFDVFSEHPSNIGICLGCVRSDRKEVEPVSEIITHIEKGKKIFDSKLKQLAPDCGLRMLPEKNTLAKLRNIVSAKEKIYG